MATDGALPGGVVSFVFTDIEGSTRIGRQLGDQFATLLADHDAILRTAVESHSGVVVKGMGDGLFAAFVAPDDALAACVDGMLALGAHRWPQDVDLRVRMAVHTGEAQPVGNDYVSSPCTRPLASSTPRTAARSSSRTQPQQRRRRCQRAPRSRSSAGSG